MDVSDFVAVLALIVSMAATAYSYRLGRRDLQVTTYQGATDLTLQMDRLFIEYPMLRPYFYGGEAVPAADGGDPDLRNRVLAAAEFVLDIVECIWDHRHSYAKDDREAWKKWIHDVFASSPACCELYSENVDWYPALQNLAAEGWHAAGVPGADAMHRTDTRRETAAASAGQP